MLSAEDIAAVKVAVDACNNPELKREVLCVPGSDYDKKKASYQVTNKKQWDEIVENKSGIILENLGLPAKLKEKVVGLALLVGMKMLTWAKYHEIILGIPREYSMNFLSCSLFTSQGIIDNKKAAEELMNDNNLNIKQKYKLACFYFKDQIPALFRQMTEKDKEEFYDVTMLWRIQQRGFVTFWSNYLMDEIDKVKRDKNVSLYMLEKTIESGSKVSVEYCLEKTDLSKRKDALVDAAIETVRSWIKSNDDFIVYQYQRYDSDRTWAPNYYYVDILCFLLSKMRDDQKIVFLKNDIADLIYKQKVPSKNTRRSRVLQCFLNWPYQDYFMNTVKLMWEFLLESDYADLLLEICDKIEANYGTLEYGEDRSYDYRGLLKEFWCQSPERFKRYVFSNKKSNIRTFEAVTFEAEVGVKLLMKLLTLRKFTHKDRKNINLILASANDQEKENIKFSRKWRDICYFLIEEEKWESLDHFVLNWFSTKEEADKFKQKLSLNYRICIDFVKNNRWSAAESYIRWIALSEKEINILKKEMIFSTYGKAACSELILVTRRVKVINTFCEWFCISDEEFGKFKRECIFPDMGQIYCSILVRENIEIADEFTKWCFSSEEIKEIKKDMAYTIGGFICETLISHNLVIGIFNEEGYFTGNYTIEFMGGNWEPVEKFLTWCFSSEREISDFKKNVLIGEQSQRIHFNLIKCNRWEDAETYFAWVGLSAEEIKKLKKDTLFSHYEASTMFSELMHSHEGDNYHKYVDYGGKQEAIELLLRWYLTDKETVLKFKDEFKCDCRKNECEISKAMFENFDMMMEQRLSDLDEA